MNGLSDVMYGWNGEREKGTKLGDIEPNHIERYNIAMKYCNNKVVLDVACGCGYGSYMLSGVAKSVVGIDNSQDAIDYANQYWKRKNISFEKGDLNVDFSTLKKFDVVVCFETIEHLDMLPKETCRKFSKLLNTKGIFVLSHPENQLSPPEKTVLHTLKSLLSVIKKHEFSTIKGRFKEGRIHGKTYHKHFGILGKEIVLVLESIGMKIVSEVFQEGKTNRYHIIVAEKV